VSPDLGFLERVRGFVFDIDGTLIRRDAAHRTFAVPGARETLEAIRASGRPFALFTNGTHIAPQAVATELGGVDLEVAAEQILTPVESCVAHLGRRHRDQRVMVVATGSTAERMAAAGVRVLGEDDPPDSADVVFVAHVHEVSMLVLERAARAVVAGARLLTASYLPAYAGADGPIFSRGAMATAAIAKASETRPTVVGKPSAAAVRAVSDRLGLRPQDLAVIGDDLRMDVGLGLTGGSRTVLVRSGISGGLDLSALDVSRRPDAAVESVAELVRAL
jgi:HAD superfamily hydrolase (TIGR01450 family)